MAHQRKPEKSAGISRRKFVGTTAMASVAALAPANAFVAGSDRIRIALIGCGRQGTRMAVACVNSTPGVELVALGDLFQDQLDSSLKSMREGNERVRMKPLTGDLLKITPDKCFVGWDAYKKVLESGVDLVLLATPPYARPQHMRAAIEAGKHVFAEKPAAVDPIGVRSVIESSELATQKGLAIVAGTAMRHSASHIEIVRRIKDGAIGEITGGQCYNVVEWGGGPRPKPAGVSDIEWQIRNWYYFTWTSGDFMTEQTIHHIDALAWPFDTPPKSVLAIGGRQTRGDNPGNIYDHFAVEYEYPNGVRTLCMTRQSAGCSVRRATRIVGSKGVAILGESIEGANPYKWTDQEVDAFTQEHRDLIDSIRKGKPLNEGRRFAETTMMSILGRMSAYTGREISWRWAMESSKLDLCPPKFEFGNWPIDPVAIPGKTTLA